MVHYRNSMLISHSAPRNPVVQTLQSSVKTCYILVCTTMTWYVPVHSRDRHDPVLAVTLLLPIIADQTHKISRSSPAESARPVKDRILKPQLLSEDCSGFEGQHATSHGCVPLALQRLSPVCAPAPQIYRFILFECLIQVNVMMPEVLTKILTVKALRFLPLLRAQVRGQSARAQHKL